MLSQCSSAKSGAKMLQRNFNRLKNMNRLSSKVLTCIAAALLHVAMPAHSDPEEIAWQDLVPPMTESFFLDNDVPIGERVRTDLDNKNVRIPGFIVPVDFEDRQVVTRFLFVPFFGACIHEPAPPPNQTIYAEFEPGYTLESLWDPFWIEGTLFTSKVVEDLATASYTLRAEKIEPFVY